MSISVIEETLNYSFNDKNLLLNALTHASYSPDLVNNERLEFLGDAVLELVISEYLYKTQHVAEGKMTRLRANIVCTESLYQASIKLKLGEQLRLGKGEKATGGKKRRRNLANVFEAVMGSIFLDSNYETVKEVILTVLHDNIIRALHGELAKDYKSELQEYIQKDKNRTIQYKDLGSVGPQHDQLFTAQIVINGINQTIGKGKTKKEAQQQAAKEYLKKVKVET